MLSRVLLVSLAASLAALASPPPSPAVAEERVDLQAISRIRDEGFNHSKVMETLSTLCDQIGPRLTGSPNLRRASDWVVTTLTKWGLANAHAESFSRSFRGWTARKASVTMLRPDLALVPAALKAWTPGTAGPRAARATLIPASPREPLAKLDSWKGKLEGRIVLLGEPRHTDRKDGHDRPDGQGAAKREPYRYDADSLSRLESFEPGLGPWDFPREKFLKARDFQRDLNRFLIEQKVLAAVESSSLELGNLSVDGGYAFRSGDETGPPRIVITAESYGRIARLLARDVEVELEIDLLASFSPEDPLATVNTLAELPGTDRKDEIVMLGAHLDSWHAGTGATDNGAGCAIVMEAMRILKSAGLHPRRTIRVALWGGEEQGLVGSYAYVASHLGGRPEPSDESERSLPPDMQKRTGPLTTKPEWKKVSAYFNVDSGGGKLRGIYCQENVAVKPIFSAWLAPLADLGAVTTTLRNDAGSDNLSFDAVGLPSFNFIQDDLDYGASHHTSMDVYERVNQLDLQQAAVVMASFVYQAAMRDELLPRKPAPL